MSVPLNSLTLPNSKKIVLIELSSGKSEPFWLNYYAGVWGVDLNGLWSRVDDVTLKPGLPTSQEPILISQVYSDATPLTLVGGAIGAISCQSNQNSFFLDGSTNILYISTTFWNNPNLHDITVGIVFGYADKASVWNGYIYEGRVISAPSIQKTKDPVFFGKISFDSGQATLENSDGALDSVAQSAMGNYAAVKVGIDPESYADFQEVYSGYVQDFDITETTAVVTIKDLRQQLSNPLPLNVIQNTNASGPYYYPYSKTNLGKLIPIGYGTILNTTCLITNDVIDAVHNPTTSNWVFLVFDTSATPTRPVTSIQSISAVYFTDSDGIKNTLTLTSQYTVNLSAGTITIVNGQTVTNILGKTYTLGPSSKITCDCVGLGFSASNIAAIQYYRPSYAGTDYSNGISIIGELMYAFGGGSFIYSASTFNVIEWEVARANAANIGIVINSSSCVIDQIQLICRDEMTSLIINDGGLYTLRHFPVVPTSITSVDSFQVSDMMQFISYTNSIENSITSTMVGYAKDWDNNTYQLLHDTSFQSQNFNLWKKYLEPSEYDTLLTNASDAQLFSNAIRNILGLPLPAGTTLVTFTTKMQALNIEIMDFIDVNVNRQSGKGFLGLCQFEVIDISKDFTKWEITIVGRLIQVYPTTPTKMGTYYGDTYFQDGTIPQTYFGLTNS